MHLSAGIVSLILVGVAFAWSMGAHYTGACMGMPYASGSIRLWPALSLMALLALLGAAMASHRVEQTVGQRLIHDGGNPIALGIVILASAFLLTTFFNRMRIPTSTIQILVFCVAGAGVVAGASVEWASIGRLALLWIAAPPAACGLGFMLTKLLDGLNPGARKHASRSGAVILVIVGAAASFTMGANDVSNATGAFVLAHLFSLMLAGIIGGVGLAIGVLTWGRPLLETVAFDIVNVDLNMATAAQFVQGAVVLTAVSFGYFTSMNQALVGAMAGAGLARGRHTIQVKTLRGILLGWLLGPLAGFLLSAALARVFLR